MSTRRIGVAAAVLAVAAAGAGIALVVVHATGGRHAARCAIVPHTATTPGGSSRAPTQGYRWLAARTGSQAPRARALWSAELSGGASDLRVVGRTLLVASETLLSGYDVTTGALRWQRPIASTWIRVETFHKIVALTGLVSADDGGSASTVWVTRFRVTDGTLLSCRSLAPYTEMAGSSSDVAGWSLLAAGDRQVLVAGNAGLASDGTGDTSEVVVTSLRTGATERRLSLHGLWSVLAVNATTVSLNHLVAHGSKSIFATLDLATGRFHQGGSMTPGYEDMLFPFGFKRDGHDVIVNQPEEAGGATQAYDLTAGRRLWQIPNASLVRDLGASRSTTFLVTPIAEHRGTITMAISAAGPRRRTQLAAFSAATGRLQGKPSRPVPVSYRWIAYAGLLVEDGAHGLAAFAASGAPIWQTNLTPGWGSEAGPTLEAAGLLVLPGRHDGTLLVFDRQGLVGRTTSNAPVAGAYVDPAMTVANDRLAIAAGRRLVVYRVG